MVVQYIDNGKRAIFEDLVFTRDDMTGYYLNSALRLRLHRAVYVRYNGAIPEGYQVHHVDHDKGNNEPENLIALSKEDHIRLHGTELTDEQREKRRDNMARNARPAASEWHRSEAGRAWHLEHYERMKDTLYCRETMVCENCGKEYAGLMNGQSRFCSNACKSAWRRKVGLDNEARVCECCGGTFVVNKYSGARSCSRECAGNLRSLRWREANS